MPRPRLSTSASSRAKADRARQWIKTGGVLRADSDDELGLDDIPWEWVYGKAPKKIGGGKEIIGARMGKFECRVGDCVLLKAEGNNEAWVGMICDFVQGKDEDDLSDDELGGVERVTGKAATFMWFSAPREIRNERKRRHDALTNELYITPSWDVNPLTSINGKAKILSYDAFMKQYPSGKVSRTSKDLGKCFICRRGCNTRTATYTEEFVWEDVYQGAHSILSLVERIESQTKATRKKRKRMGDPDNDSKDTEYHVQQEDELAQGEPQTPRKKRKIAYPLTPTSGNKQQTPKSRKRATPSTQKRIVYKKPLAITPLSTRTLSPSHTNSTPHQIARTNLHVASVPLSLPCRQNEFDTVYTHLESAITAGTGSCIYISGTPGTGKTATVREVVSQLDAAVQAEELDDFVFVEINGMKVTEPTQAYALLWEALRGERVSPAHALGLLEREFSQPSPRRVPCVVLMDELDQLVTKTQSVMYNFFNWPGLRHSRLIVLAVANTMDLPERMLSNKISSRLGLTRVLFPGYTHEQLQEIIKSRLESVPGDIVDKDAIQFAARKVAAVSGDARRCLDICRRAVEIAESEAEEALSAEELVAPNTPSKKRPHTTTEVKPPTAATGKVTIQTIKTAIQEAISSPLQQCLRSLSLSAKVFLAALLARARRTGVSECKLVDVLEEAKRLVSLAVETPRIREVLLHQYPALAPADGGVVQMLPRLRGMGAAAAELADLGVVGLSGGKARGERIGSVRLDVSDDEVGIALKGDVDVRGLGFGRA